MFVYFGNCKLSKLNKRVLKRVIKKVDVSFYVVQGGGGEVVRDFGTAHTKNCRMHEMTLALLEIFI